MVEVFKTNVQSRHTAAGLVQQINLRLQGCSASFDLEDEDRILRVACMDNTLAAAVVLDLVKSCGCQAQVLPDEVMLKSPRRLVALTIDTYIHF